MKKNLRKNFCATAIGSVPHTDAAEICERILEDYKDIPFWPQMPKRAFFENMYAQFIEGFPNAVIDEDKKKLWIDTSKDLLPRLEETYQKILDEDYGYFSITEKHALGFYEFLSRLKKRDLSRISYLKGQVTGPVSFGLSVTDEKKQSILYHPELSEVLVKILAIKAKFQIRKFKEFFDNGIIIFIDEPYLVSIGSSVVNIRKEDATSKIEEVIAAIHDEGALAGIHCCGNTDWSLLLEMEVDILSFDAYNFLKSMSLYPNSLNRFLEKNNFLAWGIIPTSEDVRKETAQTLLERLEKNFKFLADKNIDKDAVLGSLIVTPSCGCGSMSKDDADRVLSLNVSVSNKIRELYGR